MDEKHQKTGKTILIPLAAISLLIAATLLLLLAPALVETTLPNNAYAVRITGLSGLAVNGTATVMVPIPANAEGEPAISERVLAGDRQPSGWQAAVRETPYGKMLAFTTTEGYAPDIFIPFGEFETKEEPRLLVPVLATPDNSTVAEFSRLSSGTYTTVVFLDGFVPPQGEAAPVSFSLEYRGGGGMKHLVKDDTWTATVDTAVSSTESGFLPVPVEYRVIEGGIGFQ